MSCEQHDESESNNYGHAGDASAVVLNPPLNPKITPLPMHNQPDSADPKAGSNFSDLMTRYKLGESIMFAD